MQGIPLKPCRLSQSLAWIGVQTKRFSVTNCVSIIASVYVTLHLLKLSEHEPLCLQLLVVFALYWAVSVCVQDDPVDSFVRVRSFVLLLFDSNVLSFSLLYYPAGGFMSTVFLPNRVFFFGVDFEPHRVIRFLNDIKR